MTRWNAYLVAILAVFVTVALRWRLGLLLDAEYTFLVVFVLPVLVAGWLGGIGPALFATALSETLFLFFFVPPLYSLEMVDLEDYYRLSAFTFVALVIAGLAEVRRRTEVRYRLAAARAEENAANAVRSEAKTQAVLASIAEGYFCLDHEWKFREMNNAAETYFGLNREDVRGRIYWEVFPQAVGTILERRYREAVAGNRPVGFELKSPVTDRWVEVHCYPSEEGLSVYFRDISHRKEYEEERERLLVEQRRSQRRIEELYQAAQEEIAKRREAEEQLKRSNDDLQHFASIVSHDLQEPVRTSAGFATILKRRFSGELKSEANELLDLVLEGLERLKEMITGLLEYCRIERASARVEIVNLAASLDWAKINLAETIRESGASIKSDPLPEVTGDFGRFAQLFQNLIANAIKYRRPGVAPEIQILVEDRGQRWEICVQDNGIGIDPQRARDIFQPFKRLHGREIPGAGVGLAICRKIVERHGGEIWTEAVEQGARFCFTLPHAE